MTQWITMGWLDRHLGGRSFSVLLGIIIALTLMGFIVVFSATQGIDAKAVRDGRGMPFGEFTWEAFGTFVGFGIGYVLCNWRPWRRSTLVLWPLLIVLVLMILTMLFGDTFGGARRTLNVFGLFSIQPAEFLRLVLPMWVSSYLGSRWDNLDKRKSMLYYPLIFISLSVFLVLQSPDLEAGVLTGFVGVVPMLFAGVPASVTILSVISSIVVLVCSLFMSDRVYRLRRILAWLPVLQPYFPKEAAEVAKLGESQMEQARQSMNLGGIFRFAPGQTIAKFTSFPASSSDFIFVIVVEEYGLFGGFVVICVFLALGVVCFGHIMWHHPTAVGRMLAASLGAAICCQAFINIGSVLEVLPVTGLNLPLFSTGLSSRVTVAATLCVLLVLAKETDSYYRQSLAR